jgi:signal peptidase I
MDTPVCAPFLLALPVCFHSNSHTATGDQLAVDKVSKYWRGYQRKDVIVFHAPPAFAKFVDAGKKNEDLIKRIVAVEVCLAPQSIIHDFFIIACIMLLSTCFYSCGQVANRNVENLKSNYYSSLFRVSCPVHHMGVHSCVPQLNLFSVCFEQGDEIQVKEGDVYVNGKKVDEPYRNEPAQYSWGPRTVPPGMVLVLGAFFPNVHL